MGGPEPLVFIEPTHRLLHRRCRQPAGDAAAGLGAGDQSGVAEYVEVLHHCRQRDRKGPGELADRQAVFLAKPGEQRPPRWIGERGEGAVERVRLILNHLVKY